MRPRHSRVCFHVQVVCVAVSGRGRRLHRRVGLNRLQDVALCWWNLDEPGEELWPWTPENTHRNNLVLLSCSPTEGLKVQTHTHAHTHTPNQLVNDNNQSPGQYSLMLLLHLWVYSYKNKNKLSHTSCFKGKLSYYWLSQNTKKVCTSEFCIYKNRVRKKLCRVNSVLFKLFGKIIKSVYPWRQDWNHGPTLYLCKHTGGVYGVSPSSLCVFVTVGVQAAGFLVQLQPDLCSYSWQ